MVVAVARDLCVTRVTSEAGGCGQGPRARDSGRGGTGPLGVGTGIRAAAVPSGAAPGGRAAWERRATGTAGAGGIGRDRPVAAGPGRPRDRPPFLRDRAAVPCCPVTSAGARSHDVPEVRHTPQRSHAWFLTGPPLAGTDTRTNEAGPEPVTRRTGESGPELRCGHPLTCGALARPRRRRAGRGAPDRTRGAGSDAGRSRGIPGALRCARGTAPALSWPAPCPACPARPGSGRGPPSRAPGSPGGRPRRSGPPG